jgi:small-conductance mechanosensitive channel
MQQLSFNNELLNSIIFASLILLGGFMVSIWLFKLIKRLLRNQNNPAYLKVASIIQYPFKVLIILIALSIIKYQFEIVPEFKLGQIFYLLFLGVFTWLIIAVIKAFKTILLSGFKLDTDDNLRARKAHTQIRVFSRIVVFLVLFISVALALLSFEPIRQIGVSLLASAGIAGLIIGFAAQKSISMLLAGFQLAITQPIRMDDVVIVEGEWGKIEEITLTYVVVAIWDKRRLIVPVNYFIEKPFQNWTRQTAEIIGSVFIYVDYGFPIDKLRIFMDESLSKNPHWDGKVKVLQVTDCTEKSMQLRALASARDSSSAWDLRVLLREELIEFIRLNYPEYLPRTRLSLDVDETELV